MTPATSVRAAPASAARPRWAFRPGARVRILGWYVLLVTVAVVIGLFTQRSILLSQLDSEIDEQMRQEAEELQQLSAGNNPNTGRPFAGDVRAIFDTFLRRNIPVADEALFTIVDGRPYISTVTPVQLLDDPAAVEAWASVREPTFGSLDSEIGDVRYLAIPVLAADEVAGVFVVATFLEPRRADVNEVVRVGGTVFGISFLLASVLAWFAAGRVLRPVRALTETARSISEENWTQRIPVRGDDEIVELSRTFNEMLDRLEGAFAVQRQFVDDAGHELRTPITIIRGHLELLDDDPASREETVRLVLDELDGMTRIVDDLLLLAKSDSPDFLSVGAVDVGEFMEQVAARASALGDRGWSIEESASVVVVADRQRLTQAMMNLVRNAVEHTPEGTPVALGSDVDGDTARLWVRDAGPGISLTDQARIFERFSRGGPGTRRTDGAGLGLAIVSAIVKAHGGHVELASRPGAGATFTLVIPIDREEVALDASDPDR